MAQSDASCEFNKVYVNLANLKKNYQTVKEYSSGRKLMAVVKGDAYGHGLTECSRALVEAGADCLGVLDANEGVRIREAKITEPDIFILAGIDSPNSIREALFHNLSVAAYDFPQLALLGKTAGDAGKKLKVFLKTDTGMGRLGVREDDAMEFVRKSLEYPFLEVLGLSTHLPAVGDQEAVLQLERFNSLCSEAEKILQKDLLNSALSGGAILAHPNYPDGLSRPGLVLYGTPPLFCASGNSDWGGILGKDAVKPFSQGPDPFTLAKKLLPVMRVVSRIIQLKTIRRGESVSYERTFRAERDSLIAIAPFGYVTATPVLAPERPSPL
jgi:alanine racemase